MDKNQLITYLYERLRYLNKWKLSHLIYSVRNKNEGRIEELEDIIYRIQTDNLKDPEHK
ncbi:hypothetical protein I8J29_16255 [Paenibacillus sp. MWE-103]|uniref:Fur-regulated basic protein A n=1 Tax=Paenibacillus artemisiicola TaxID=1172618 RepID=A0ABS3WBU0_9BACL|nr:hypothetical protein [Paenibacillus artemisiicola]MBO7745763.1 hypothetical protein [Paenibacillus artemisiicola]